MEETVEKLDIENLDKEELGISDAAIDALAAGERKKAVETTYVLRMRLDHSRLSERANQTFGNINAAKEYQNMCEVLKIKIAHGIRVVKKIDKEYPKAKEIMQRMFGMEIENDTAT